MPKFQAPTYARHSAWHSGSSGQDDDKTGNYFCFSDEKTDLERQSYFSRLHRWKMFVSGLEPGHIDFKDRGISYCGNIITSGIEMRT